MIYSLSMKRCYGALVTASFFLLSFAYAKQTMTNTPYSLDDTLNVYGFTTPAQKRAFKDILQRASIISEEKSWKKMFPQRKTKEELAKDILILVQQIQKKLVVRKGAQERWGVESLQWMNKDPEKIISDLETLGFVDPISPIHQQPDAICILGSIRPRMINRIHYAASLKDKGVQSDTIILLSGERYVTVNVDADGTKEELSLIAEKNHIPLERLTETDLIKEIYASSRLAQQGGRMHVIDTPKGSLPRPTTQTTMRSLIDWLKEHKNIKNILFISNQPYVHYQQAIIDSTLKGEEANFLSFEVAGSAVQDTSNLQPLLEGLGSYIYAVSPSILTQLNIAFDDPAIKESFQKIYGNNPLVYQGVPQQSRKLGMKTSP